MPPRDAGGARRRQRAAGDPAACGFCACCLVRLPFVLVDPADCRRSPSPSRSCPSRPGAPAGNVCSRTDSRGRCPLLDERGRARSRSPAAHLPRLGLPRHRGGGHPGGCRTTPRRAGDGRSPTRTRRARAEHDAVRAAARFGRDHASWSQRRRCRGSGAARRPRGARPPPSSSWGYCRRSVRTVRSRCGRLWRRRAASRTGDDDRRPLRGVVASNGCPRSVSPASCA